MQEVLSFLSDHLALIIASVCILAAAFFTAVPYLPGTLFIFAAALSFGFIESFDSFPWYFWVGQAVLAVGYILIDNIAQAFGVKKLGASKQAMWGSMIGVFIGPIILTAIIGPLSIFFGPPLGAIIGALAGEYIHKKKMDEQLERNAATKIALGSLLSYVVGTMAKFTILTVQIIWLAIAIF